MHTSTKWKEQSLLGVRDLSKSEIQSILDRAAYWEQQKEKVVSRLSGCFFANLFFENSTRTRCSFEMAQKRLGAHVLHFTVGQSSMNKGECLYDTVRTIEALGIDAVVVRLSESQALSSLAEKIRVPLINAGDGDNEHPTQALLDLYTMQKTFGSLKGLNVAIVGDIKHSRVARSNVYALQKFGANIVLCAPPNMQVTTGYENIPYVTIEEALYADVIMMLRVQLERHKGQFFISPEIYREQYGMTEERAAKLRKKAIIMHPAPVNRNVEIDDAVVESAASRIFAQVSHGVAIRMAVMERAMYDING